MNNMYSQTQSDDDTVIIIKKVTPKQLKYAGSLDLNPGWYLPDAQLTADYKLDTLTTGLSVSHLLVLASLQNSNSL